MRAEKTLQELLADVEGHLDGRWWRRIWGAAAAALRGRVLQLTRLGRMSTGKTSAKHRIKAVDRLLGSMAVQSVLWIFYRSLARRLLGSAQMVDVLIDWTQLRGRVYALVAAVPVGGRAVPILCHVHRDAQAPTRTQHRRFLRQLAEVLPPGCLPTLITDAGFQGSWIRDVAARGWCYIARLRHKTNVRPAAGGAWIENKALHAQARRGALDLGPWQIGRDKPRRRFEGRLVLASRPRKGRHRLGRRGKPLQGGSGIVIRKRHKEPWLLVTNRAAPAEQIVAAYARRMQIEEIFRDAKSAQLGLGFVHARTESPGRLAVLLLIGVLALVSAMLVGMAAKDRAIGRRLQANTSRDQVFSIVQLGLLILATPGAGRPPPAARRRAFRRLAAAAAGPA